MKLKFVWLFLFVININLISFPYRMVRLYSPSTIPSCIDLISDFDEQCLEMAGIPVQEIAAKNTLLASQFSNLFTRLHQHLPNNLQFIWKCSTKDLCSEYDAFISNRGSEIEMFSQRVAPLLPKPELLANSINLTSESSSDFISLYKYFSTQKSSIFHTDQFLDLVTKEFDLITYLRERCFFLILANNMLQQIPKYNFTCSEEATHELKMLRLNLLIILLEYGKNNQWDDNRHVLIQMICIRFLITLLSILQFGVHEIDATLQIPDFFTIENPNAKILDEIRQKWEQNKEKLFSYVKDRVLPILVKGIFDPTMKKERDHVALSKLVDQLYGGIIEQTIMIIDFETLVNIFFYRKNRILVYAGDAVCAHMQEYFQASGFTKIAEIGNANLRYADLIKLGCTSDGAIKSVPEFLSKIKCLSTEEVGQLLFEDPRITNQKSQSSAH